MLRLANAPVSFGVFEMAAEDGAYLMGPDQMCRVVADAGYQGIDSGPIGFLGRGQELRDRLSLFDLGLAGGWCSLPFATGDGFDQALERLRADLKFFAAAGERHGLLPKPTLADDGSAERVANPGGGPQFELSAEQFAAFAQRVGRAADLVRGVGLEPTFHHHACTYVETPAEIDKFLEATTVDLTFDTGHLLIGGGDPLTDFARWKDRINHVHLKDVKVAELQRIVAARGAMRDVWMGGVFVPLGQGDLDVDGFMEALLGSGYDGWLVIEQDVIPRPGDDPDGPSRDQVTNREALRKWLP